MPCLRSIVAVALAVTSNLGNFLKALVRSRTSLAAENLFLRKQLAFYKEHKMQRQPLTDAARYTLVVWSPMFDWKNALLVVKPDTLISWHRKGFKLFWRRKSRPGRPPLDPQIRALIVRMAEENPTWGQMRVAAELYLKLGILVSPRTVRNHADAIVACDFLVAVTTRFQILYVNFGTRLATDSALQRHGASHRRMDFAAVS